MNVNINQLKNLCFYTSLVHSYVLYINKQFVMIKFKTSIIYVLNIFFLHFLRGKKSFSKQRSIVKFHA